MELFNQLFSHEFSRTEKILIVLLSLLFVVLVYYQFLYKPVKREIEECSAKQEALSAELTQVQTRLAQLRRMQDELDRLGRIGYTSRMPSYNNSVEEISFLNTILEPAQEYSITFSNVTRNGDQIRRNFSLVFQASSYELAEQILVDLTSGEDRCLLGDVRYSTGQHDGVSMSVAATFFETLSGGTPDAGLPNS